MDSRAAEIIVRRCLDQGTGPGRLAEWLAARSPPGHEVSVAQAAAILTGHLSPDDRTLDTGVVSTMSLGYLEEPPADTRATRQPDPPLPIAEGNE